MKKAFVTGALGFCGRYLCDSLSSQGISVVGSYLQKVKPIKKKNVRLEKLNITDRDATLALIKKHQPDVIFHLAALSIPRLSWEYELETFKANVAGTINLLDGMRRYAPKARMVFASTVQVYGRSFRDNKPVKEDSLAWPESPYGASKMTAELACLDYHNRYGLDVVIARPFNHFGVGQSPRLVLSDWSRQVAMAEKKGNPEYLCVGNLGVWREFMNVKDVIQAYELLATKGKSGQVYNIGTEKKTYLKDYVKRLVKESKVPMQVKVEKERLRTDDPKVMTGNAKKLKKLGWKPEFSPFDTLQEMLDDWRNQVA